MANPYGSTSYTTTGLGITGFDTSSTHTGALTSAAGVFSAFVLTSTNISTAAQYVWNWSAPMDGDFNPITGPVDGATPYNETITQPIASGTDAWTLTIDMVQFSTGSSQVGTSTGDVAGDFLHEDGAFGNFITSTATSNDSNLGTTTNSGTTSGSGANSLAAFIQGLSINLNAGVHNGAEVFGLQFHIHNVTTNTDIPVFTEVFQPAQDLSPCYVAGTRIATPAGETLVETLAIGDLVATASGIAKPVKWIGTRSYTAAQVAANAHLRPVLIRAGALAAGMPHRDLLVSSMHGMFLDDVFVPAAALVNGVSILRSEDLVPVAFIHIELDGHDVIFADGAPAETFVDDESRLMFDNADEYYDIYGADEPRLGFSAPRIEEGYQLEAVRTRLALRAGLAAAVETLAPALRGHVERVAGGAVHGWVTDSANPASPVELDILVEGESIGRVLANRYRADLDHAGIAGGRCAFTVSLPAAVTSLDQVEIRHTATGMALAKNQVAALAD